MTRRCWHLHMRSVLLLALLGTFHGAAAEHVEIVDERARTLLAVDAPIETLSAGYAWTEGPLWIAADGYLLFSDIPNNRVHKYVPGVGTSVYLEKSGATGLHSGDSSQGSNGLLLNRAGELVLFQQGDRRVAVMEAPLEKPSADFRTLVDQYNGGRLNSPNDGVFHSDGSLYFTDPPYGLPMGFADPGRDLAFQGVFRLATDGSLQLLDRTLSAPNGIALSRDEGTLYVAVSDEKNPAWFAYNVTADGGVDGRRVFFDPSSQGPLAPGLPDGMTVHSTGTLFATGPGGVWVFSPDGDLLARIHTGRKAANCTLSDDEKILFITAHDTLMSVPLR